MTDQIPVSEEPRRRAKRVTARSGGEQKTVQADAASLDINNIVKRWEEQGAMPPVDPRVPNYGNFASGADFHRVMNTVAMATQDFSALPAEVRDFCKNDLGNFLDNLGDPDKLADMVSAGLLEEHIPEDEKPFRGGEAPQNRPEGASSTPENQGGEAAAKAAE